MASPWFPPPLEKPEEQQHESSGRAKTGEDGKSKFWNRALKRLPHSTSNKGKDKAKPLFALRTSQNDHRASKREKPFPFFQLPAEIRNLIYGFTFTSPTDDDISPWEVPKPASHWLQALLTCRTFHQEAGLIAFSCVLFIVRFLPSYDHLRERFARLSTAQIQSIRRLGGMLFGSDHGFNCSDHQRAVWFYMRNEGVKLEELVYLSYWPKKGPRRRYFDRGLDERDLPDLMFYLYRFLPSTKRIIVYCDGLTGWEQLVQTQDDIRESSGGRLKLQRRDLERCDERDLIAWDVIEASTGDHVHSFRLRRSNQFDQMRFQEIELDGNFRGASAS